MPNILLGLTGSVATVAGHHMANALSAHGDVRIVMSEKAILFKDPEELRSLSYDTYVEHDDWPQADGHVWKNGDAVPHIELRDWADILVVAPISANKMAQMANGLCDDMLSSICRAWDFRKPIVLAPAMNTKMWEHPVTQKHLDEIKSFFPNFRFFRYHNATDFHLVDPIEKKLACGGVGLGAMAHTSTIADEVKKALRWLFPLTYCSVVPNNDHPGAFGVFREKHGYTHPGVDLYVPEDYLYQDHVPYVYAVEPGEVISVHPFTGPSANLPWWNDTDAVLIRGKSGTIGYGEIEVAGHIHPGKLVNKGEIIGKVVRVLKTGAKSDIFGHNHTMLHMELYPSETDKTHLWPPDSKEASPYHLDPTPYLLDALGSPGGFSR